MLRIIGVWVPGLLTPDISNKRNAFISKRQGTASRKSTALFLSAIAQNTKIVNIFNVLNTTGDVRIKVTMRRVRVTTVAVEKS
jgi:hypothetical protein